MQYNYINSKEVVMEVIDNFNIKSFEFIGRTPMWITNCLNDLKIYQTYVNMFSKLEFNNYRCKLPMGTKRINAVLVNDLRAAFTHDELTTLHDYSITTQNKDLYTIGSLEQLNMYVTKTVKSAEQTEDTEDNPNDTIYRYMGIDSNPFRSYNSLPILERYTLENGWLHFETAEEGTVLLAHGCLPIDLDVDTRLYYPLIPDVEPLKEALRWYIMRILLQRGYKHPIINLTDSNAYTNAGLAYDKSKLKARVKSNSMNLDRRTNLTDILNTFIQTQDFTNTSITL